MNDKQITEILADPNTINEHGIFINGAEYVRSALKAEQKPVEPKTVTLGPDTPSGWYRIVRAAHAESHANTHVGEVLLLGQHYGEYSIFGEFAFDHGAILEPVEPPVEEDENFQINKDGDVEFRINNEWRYVPQLVVAKIRAAERASVLREINEKIGH